MSAVTPITYGYSDIVRMLAIITVIGFLVYLFADAGYAAMEHEIQAQEFAAKPENRIYGSYDDYRNRIANHERVEETR
jgi:hypothetical protein